MHLLLIFPLPENVKLKSTYIIKYRKIIVILKNHTYFNNNISHKFNFYKIFYIIFVCTLVIQVNTQQRPLQLIVQQQFIFRNTVIKFLTYNKVYAVTKKSFLVMHELKFLKYLYIILSISLCTVYCIIYSYFYINMTTVSCMSCITEIILHV